MAVVLIGHEVEGVAAKNLATNDGLSLAVSVTANVPEVYASLQVYEPGVILCH